MKKFMIHISFFTDEEFYYNLAPHMMVISNLINKGVIDSYAESFLNQELWIVLNADNENLVTNYLKQSPLYSYWTISINELHMFDGQIYRLPKLQLN